MAEGPVAATSERAPITDRLLAAAVDVFAEKGYDGAGVAEIARRAGVTTGAIYSRYSGKAQLLAAALDSQMADHIEAVLASAELGGPADALAMLGSHVLDHPDDTEGLFLEAVVSTRREPELAEMLLAKLDDERRRVAKVLDEAKSDGLFDPELDTDAVLTLIQAIGLGFTVLRSIGTPMPDPDAWQAVVGRIIAAAAPPQTPAPPGAPATPQGDQP